MVPCELTVSSDIHIGSSGKTNKKRTQKVGTKEQAILSCRYFYKNEQDIRTDI